MDSASEITLPVIEGKVPDAVSHVVESMVRVHRLVEHHAITYSPDVPFLGAGLGDIDPGQPPMGADSIYQILPFLDNAQREEEISALIPVRRTLGGSWRWRHASVEPHDRARLTQYLTAPQRAVPGEPDRSETFLVKPLGLFFASEGKNRVAYLEKEGIDFMPSRVRVLDYPAPERMAIHEVDHGGPRMVLCVLDDKWVALLRSPEWSLPLLEAYGVRSGPWPSGLPPLELVCMAICARRASTSSRWKPVSLDDIREIAAEQRTQPVTQPLFRHELIRLRPGPRHIALGAVTLLAMLTAGLWPNTWTVPLGWTVALTALGAFAGACAVCLLPARLDRDTAQTLAQKETEQSILHLDLCNHVGRRRRRRQALQPDEGT